MDEKEMSDMVRADWTLLSNMINDFLITMDHNLDVRDKLRLFKSIKIKTQEFDNKMTFWKNLYCVYERDKTITEARLGDGSYE